MIQAEDLLIETYRPAKSGQQLNITSTAVRITHLPTGKKFSHDESRSYKENIERCIADMENELGEKFERNLIRASD